MQLPARFLAVVTLGLLVFLGLNLLLVLMIPFY